MAQVHNRQDIILEALNEEKQQQNKQTRNQRHPSFSLHQQNNSHYDIYVI